MTDDYTYTVKLKRGDGHDVQKCKVTANTIEGLEERVDAVREKMSKWAYDYREIQPESRSSRAAADDDQQQFEEVQA